MPKPSVHAPSGVVSSLQGPAQVVRAGTDVPQPLRVGDKLAAGDVVLAAADARIEVSDAAGQAWLPLDVAAADTPARASHGQGDKASAKAAVQGGASGQPLDDVLGAVERGDEDAATAAGLTGAGGASLGEGLRVDRVIEVVTPQAFSESTARAGVSSLVTTTAPQASAGDAAVATPEPQPQTPANTPPKVGNYNATTDEDKPVSGKVAGTDADGDKLTYSKASDPQHGTVAVNQDGTYTYTPAKDYNGADSFTVQVSDGKGGTALSTVNIEVTPVNDPPKFDDPKNGNYDPVTGHYSATTDEDKPVSGKVTATDVDGDTLTYAKDETKDAGPKNGTVTVDAQGHWTYTPDKDYNGPDSFKIIVSDGKGGTATATVDIGVNPVNDPPKFEDPKDGNYDPVTGHYSATTDEDKPVSGKVTASDVDGDSLTFAKGTDPAHGTVTVDAQGNWTYTPAKDYNGADSFTITVSDGKGGTATATVDIGVNPVNDPPKFDTPTAGNGDPETGHYQATTDEDKPVSGKVTASDVDGDSLTFAKGTDPAHGTVTVDAQGNWTYTPAKDYNGADSFTITVSDGKGGSATATVDIGVNPVNDPPKFEDPKDGNYDPVTGHYSATTDEDKPVSGKVTASDVDGDSLTFAKGTDPTHGTVTVDAQGNWTYTPAKDYNGADSFTITVSDGKGGTATATVDIGINPVNDPPKFDTPTAGNGDPVTGHYQATTDEDKPVSGKVSATDVDGDALSFAKGTDPAHGSVTVDAQGNWTYTPAKDYNGADSFTITVSDGKGGTATATVDIGVNPVNDPPKFEDPKDGNYDPVTGHYQATTDEDKPVSGKVTASDVDGDSLTFAKGTDPAHGTVTVDAQGNWTYTPAKDYNGADSFTITVSDGKGGTATATVDIGVNPVNDPPKFDTPTAGNGDPETGHYQATTDEDKPVSGKVTASDVDGDSLTFAKGTDPTHGTVTVDAQGNWTYTPAKDYNGADSFTITVSDGKGGTATATVDIGVNPVNDPPKFDTPTAGNGDPVTGHYSATTDEDKPVSGKVTASDVDGDSLTFAKGTDPAHGTVTVDAQGNWTYTPAKDYNGADSFTITVSDGKGGTATATVDIGVNPVNDPPKFEDPKDGNYDPVTGHYSATTDEDKPVSGKVTASDVDGDSLTFAKGTDPAHGTVTVDAQGNWTYTPAKDYNGADSFTITVSDGKGGTATATVDIGVNPVNDPPKFDTPTAGNGDPETGHYQATTDEDKPVSGKVTASDVDGDSLTFAKGTDPAHGTVTVDAQGNWTYTPAKDYNGADSFTITVSDGKGGSATATVDIGVNPVNDAPVITHATATVSEEGLAGANADNTGSTGNNDTTNAREASGHITVNDVDSNHLTLTLSGPNGLSSGGTAITWSGDGSASNPLVGSAGGKTVLTATIDANGDYKIALQAPIDHAGAGEDVRSIDLTVKASDGTSVGTGTLTLNVEDDAPLSGAQTVQVNAVTSAQNTNLMLIIDTSGSMEDRLNDKTASGIKAAIKGLIDQYDGLGDVKVQIITFSDKGEGQKLWMSVSDAKALIDKLTGDGGTNYDAALAAAQKAFAYDGKIAGGVNVSYFVTDGQPNDGKGLNGSDETKWESFLTTNAIDSYAIGTGSMTSQYVANIEPIAYNGITGKEQPAVTLATNAELSKYLLDTVPVVKTGTLATLAGADGLQKIESFSAAGQLGSSLDSKTQVLTIQLKSGGEMKVNMLTGEFTLTQPKGAAAESFSYSMLDKDGDRGTGTVSLSVTNHAPEGTSGSVTLLEDGSYTFKSADFGFKDQDAGDSLRAVRIDGLPAHGALSLDGVAVVQGQLISAADLAKLVFTPEHDANGNNYAQLSFSVQDSYGAFDTSPHALQINVTPVNDAPEVFANQGGFNLLGLVDLSVNPLLNLLKTQTFAVNDVDNNLTKVEIRVTELISLGKLLGGHDALTVSTDATLTQGLHITGNGTGDLVITSATNGGTLDVSQINKLLGTLHFDHADVLGVNVDVLPFITITATDAGNLSASQTVQTSLLSVGVDVQPLLAAGESLVSGHGDHTGACGTEVFQWALADRPASGEHCVDTIHGFDGSARTAGGDVLDLRDLLSGEHASVANGQVDVGNLLNHLDFDTQSQPGSTVIHVSATGGFSADTSGNSHSEGCANQQQIVLAGVDIRSSLGLDAQANDHQIIAELMQRGKLLVDHS